MNWMNAFSFRVLPFKVHQLLVSMVSFPLPLLSFHQSACVREWEREGESENDLKLLAVVISPLHKVPFALPNAWIVSEYTPASSYGSLPGLQSQWVCINSSNLWSPSKTTRFDRGWKKKEREYISQVTKGYFPISHNELKEQKSF